MKYLNFYKKLYLIQAILVSVIINDVHLFGQLDDPFAFTPANTYDEHFELKGFGEAQLGLQGLRVFDELGSNLNYSGFAIPASISYLTLDEKKKILFVFNYTNTKLSNKYNESFITGYNASLDFQYRKRITNISILNSRFYAGGYLKTRRFRRQQNNLFAMATSSGEQYYSIGPHVSFVKDTYVNQFLLLGIRLPLVSYLSDLESATSASKGLLFFNKLNDFNFDIKYIIKSNNEMYLSFSYLFEFYSANRDLFDVHYGAHSLTIGFLIKI